MRVSMTDWTSFLSCSGVCDATILDFLVALNNYFCDVRQNLEKWFRFLRDAITIKQIISSDDKYENES